MSILDFYVSVDMCWQAFEPLREREQLAFGRRQHRRATLLSQALAKQLFTSPGILLITKLLKNMCERVLAFTDELLLRKRMIIESVNDYLKNTCQVEHTRHRSPYYFLAHLLAGLVSYCHLPKKPSLHLHRDLNHLMAG